MSVIPAPLQHGMSREGKALENHKPTSMALAAAHREEPLPPQGASTNKPRLTSALHMHTTAVHAHSLTYVHTNLRLATAVQ